MFIIQIIDNDHTNGKVSNICQQYKQLSHNFCCAILYGTLPKHRTLLCRITEKIDTKLPKVEITLIPDDTRSLFSREF